jgi:hypothetical protein
VGLLLYLYVKLHYVHKDRLVAILLLNPEFNLVFWLLQLSRRQLYYRFKIRQFISLSESCVECIISKVLEITVKEHHTVVEIRSVFEVESASIDTSLPCIYLRTCD